MSRKADIIQACNVFEIEGRGNTLKSMDEAFYAALEAAYDLGRAAQAEKDRDYMETSEEWEMSRRLVARLRNRVRKLLEGN